MTDPKKISFYVRVSRDQQELDSQSFALREFCRRSGWQAPGKRRVFAEKISGKRERRAELDRLLQAARDGHIDTVLCYSVSRIGRTAAHTLTVFNELQRLRVRVISIVEGVDSANEDATARWKRDTLAVNAEYDHARISENTRAGLRAARAAGRVGGRRFTKEGKAKLARVRKLVAAGKLLRPGDPGFNGGFRHMRGGKSRTSDGKMTLREMAKHVGLDAGYLSRVLKREAKKTQ